MFMDTFLVDGMDACRRLRQQHREILQTEFGTQKQPSLAREHVALRRYSERWSARPMKAAMFLQSSQNAGCC